MVVISAVTFNPAIEIAQHPCSSLLLPQFGPLKMFFFPSSSFHVREAESIFSLI